MSHFYLLLNTIWAGHKMPSYCITTIYDSKLAIVTTFVFSLRLINFTTAVTRAGINCKTCSISTNHVRCDYHVPLAVSTGTSRVGSPYNRTNFKLVWLWTIERSTSPSTDCKRCSKKGLAHIWRQACNTNCVGDRSWWCKFKQREVIVIACFVVFWMFLNFLDFDENFSISYYLFQEL